MLRNFFVIYKLHRVGIRALALGLKVPIIQGVDNRTKYFCRDVDAASRCYTENTSFAVIAGLERRGIFMSQAFDLWLDGIKELLKAILQPLKEYCGIFSNFWTGLGVVGVIFALFLGYSIIKYGNQFGKLMGRSKTLVISALMIALNIVLGYYSIWFSSYLRVGFGFVTQPIVAVLYGPLVACMTGMIQDILSYLINPVGGYIPVYTLCVGISGMVYGLMLYRKPLTFSRVVLVKTIVLLFANILLNSIALAPTVGSGFIGILPARIIKNLLLLPIQIVVVYLVLKLLKRSRIS